MDTKTKTALITGASSGIGYELAKLFIKDNYALVIVSKDAQKLKEIAKEFRKQGATNVTVLAKDLSIAGTAAEVYNETKQKGIHIDVLVNDAGVGEYGLFKETDLEKELAIIQLNISSLVHLTKLYLKDMLAEQSGRILNLSSVAAYQPTPKLAVYAATKAFVLSFTDAIGRELKDSNINVTTLIPKSTDTDFFNKAGMEHIKTAQNDPDDPVLVAKIGYDALMKGETHALAPGVRKQILMSSLLPNETVASQAEKQTEITSH